jgi:radical SAM superfamily enzyme YgiQ (UPF0313 family)
MKIVISYPPLKTEKGCPTLGQNRQFQYFKEPTFIYPIVPAQAATLLKKAGHEVIWNDCIAESWSQEQFLNFVQNEKPDLLALETKTPVIQQHWRLINKIKEEGLRNSGLKAVLPKIVLFGDHVTALPEESFENSKVDFVITGGDYDFLLLNLCQALKELDSSGVAQLISRLEPGIYFRDNNQIKNSGSFKLNHDLDSLPFIDRDLTHWQLYAFKNGNFKRTPGTYIMSGRDCWWANCTFCSWPTLYPKFRVRNPQGVLREIQGLIKNYGVREIMDDSGCFPKGQWLEEFCDGMIRQGLDKEIYLDCNMRFGALTKEEFILMKKANFRLLLFGLESANQKTLDRINKNLKVETIIQDCLNARKAGLFPHITIMFGYPWETYEEALNTLRLGRWLLKKGLAYTMQATVVIPYPGSPLFKEARQNQWLKDLGWDSYDMKQPVMQTQVPEKKIMQLVSGMYSVSFHPEFILRKILSLRDYHDLDYYLRAAKKVIGHIFDFK